MRLEKLNDTNNAIAADLIARTFMDEEMVRALDISYIEMLNVAKQAALGAVKDGLSYLALKETRTPLGVIISYNTQPPELIASEKFDHLFSVLEKLNDGITLPEPRLYLFMSGVEKEHRSKGIADLLLKECERNAVNHGIYFVKTEATGIASQRVLEKNGYETLNEVIYGVNNPFITTKSKSCKLMVKKLDL